MASLEQRATFLTLPAEIRNYIYKYHLANVVRLLVARKPDRVKKGQPNLPEYDIVHLLHDQKDNNAKNLKAIFKVNRLIRDDVLPLIKALPRRFRASYLSGVQFLTRDDPTLLPEIDHVTLDLKEYEIEEPHNLLKIFEALPFVKTITITHQTSLPLTIGEILPLTAKPVSGNGQWDDLMDQFRWTMIERKVMQHCNGASMDWDHLVSACQQDKQRSLEVTFVLRVNIVKAEPPANPNPHQMAATLFQVLTQLTQDFPAAPQPQPHISRLVSFAYYSHLFRARIHTHNTNRIYSA